MAICIVKSTTDLGPNMILTPERYNPKRRMDLSDNGGGVLLSEIVDIVDNAITVKKANGTKCYQINTSDAMGGYLNIPSVQEVLNCNKKAIETGDVIISRLRPYLRQIAYVDSNMQDGILAASTEFYVLRSKSTESIAFLVPFLLSESVQTVFANSVEGSQHPRFKEEDLKNIIIPRSIFDKRKEISAQILDAIVAYRSYESAVKKQVIEMNTIMNAG